MQYDYPLIEAAEEIGYFIEHPGNERVTPSMVIAHIMFSFETDPVVPRLHIFGFEQRPFELYLVAHAAKGIVLTGAPYGCKNKHVEDDGRFVEATANFVEEGAYLLGFEIHQH